MAKRGRGKAKETVGNPMWRIVDGSNTTLSRFDHDRFSHIWDGAQVQFLDADEDGICEFVESVAKVDELVVAAAGRRRFARNARRALSEAVVVGSTRKGQARSRLKAKIHAIRQDEKDTETVTLAMLRVHGIDA